MKRSFAGYTISLLTILGVINWGNYARAQEAATGFVQITVENVTELELGYALRGGCSMMSPDSTMMLVGYAFYSVADGQMLFGDTDEPYYAPRAYTFSPDMSLIAVTTLGVYEFDLHQDDMLRFSIGGLSSPAVFNSTGTLLAVPYDAVYNTATGDRILEIIDAENAAFSPDDRMLAVSGDAVYDTVTWQQIFPLPPDSSYIVFSPNSQLMLLSGDAVYDTATWQQVFILNEDPIHAGYNSTFSFDGALLSISSQGVYDTTTWELLFEMDYFGSFNPDGTLFVLSYDGVYDTQSWTKHADIVGSARFSPDGTYILTNEFNGGLEHSTCFIYGYAGNDWAFRSGLLSVGEGVNWGNPPGSGGWRVSPGYVAALARTPDSEYFRVDNTRWVAAEDVEIISMPDDVPVENP